MIMKSDVISIVGNVKRDYRDRVMYWSGMCTGLLIAMLITSLGLGDINFVTAFFTSLCILVVYQTKYVKCKRVNLALKPLWEKDVERIARQWRESILNTGEE